MAAFSSFCLSNPPISLRTENFAEASKIPQNVRNVQDFSLFFKDRETLLFSQAVSGLRRDTWRSRSFIGGLKVTAKPKLRKNGLRQKRGGVSASWMVSSQIASSAFTLGTVAVLPLYTLMVLSPESALLPGILKMLSSEMTLASTWIHLLVVDLFAARQVYCDGLEHQIETRHSVSLCLFFCPVGILIHEITRALARTASTSNRSK